MPTHPSVLALAALSARVGAAPPSGIGPLHPGYEKPAAKRARTGVAAAAAGRKGKRKDEAEAAEAPPTPASASAPAPVPSEVERAVDAARERVSALVDGLRGAFAERGTAISLLVVGAVARQHVLLLGPPGCGKSALVRAFAAAGQRSYFETLVGATTTPDDILGPISLRALADHDRLTRKTAGRLADVEMAFVDEVFKCNSKTLNSLLAAMNERLVHVEDERGVRAMPIPLRQIAAAANELPDARAETLAAFDDRLPLRVVVERIEDDAAARGVLFGGVRPAVPALEWGDLDALAAAADVLPVSAAARDAIMATRAEIHAAGIRVSDRRWVAVVACVRAVAVLAGADEATTAHLDVVRHAVWSRPEQRAAIDPIVDRHGAPWLAAMQDAAAEVERLRGDIDRARGLALRGERIVAVGGLVARIADLRASIVEDLAGAPAADIERLQARAAALADAADEALVAR